VISDTYSYFRLHVELRTTPFVKEHILDLRLIPGAIRRLRELADAVSALETGRSVSLDGVQGGSCALLVAAIAEAFPKRPLCLVLPQSDLIDKTADDLALFSPANTETFPALENLYYADSQVAEDDEFSAASVLAHADDLFGTRLKLLKNLLSAVCPLPSVLCTSISALLQPVPAPQTLQERTCRLKVGEEFPQQQLIRRLLDGGYHSTSGVDLPGEYAVRGSLIDVFAPDWDKPVRIEFFGDEIESIRRFDIATQRSVESLDEIDLSQVRADEVFTAQLADYLSDDTIVVLLEVQELESQGRTYRKRFESGSLHQTSDVLKRLLKFQTVSLSNLGQGYLDEIYHLPIQSVERLHGDLATVKKLLDETEGTIGVICPTEAEITRLLETFAETKPMREGRLKFSVGNISGGFCMQDGSSQTADGRPLNSAVSRQPSAISLISSTQLFDRQEIRRTRRRQLGQVIDSFTELKTGDLVVHIAHGIGRFRGLEVITKGEQEEEYLKLEFADNTVLYVPVSKIAMVQKYVGGTKSRPILAKLGGQLWNRHKKAVQDAVFDLAVEMIDLQAARATFPGIAYPDDTDWQFEFDAAFPYQETEDQLVAIDAIKNDMRQARPMDRLICGDVGFGKTEVAMRAAFKAVDAGYQVAVLVPTTILAEQHYRTFSERMRGFPFTIAALSRFQSKKEQAQIVEHLALGMIDIVIGTHRVVSKDVRFHNLGLVVIDEEQRFGVDHKERLKRLRQTVDILTLTATPIPRTLHFSLVGLRDISNLETPPEDRMAVETKLARFDANLVRSAILRELGRGGQIFFVHNRVMDIEETAAKLHKIVPEAKIGIGHAQMPENELEAVMREFVNHEFDLLVCTTIIESGLDIPNANTIFIDRADRYGLADLHQLRGRVGRYKNQAYCYLLLDANQPLTPVAAKRLRAIEEFSHLGAGFNLAMRDLEIRGAGNILGTQQSGHIATVGYEMYCQFLEGAVRTLKQLPQKEQIQVEIDLPGKVLLPKSYIANQRMKIDLYRRITRISNDTEQENIRNEMIDRFGKPPREVERLLIHAQIRAAAHRYRIRKILIETEFLGGTTRYFLVLEFVSQNLIEELKKRTGLSIRMTDEMKAYIPLPDSISIPEKSPDKVLGFVRGIFVTL